MKVATLEGHELDYWVARAEGWTPVAPPGHWTCGGTVALRMQRDDDVVCWKCSARAYSTEWEYGGPIIERERIDVVDYDGNMWIAMFPDLKKRRHTHSAYGRTPLVAAMRCFVASKFGEEVPGPEDAKALAESFRKTQAVMAQKQKNYEP